MKIRSIVCFLFSLLSFQAQAQTVCTQSEVRTEVIILAGANRVWELLCNTDEYKNWHPYITSVDGALKLHKKIKVHTIDANKQPGKFKAYILTLEPNKELAWGGSLGFIFRARHYYIIEPINSGSVKFIQGEYWRGWFGKSFGKRIYKTTFNNFNIMNQNMKLILEPILEGDSMIRIKD